jgi:hypothetical protein
MSNIIYDPEKTGEEFINKKGRRVRYRKHHLTDEEIIKTRIRWKKEVENVDPELIERAGVCFFNPYRKGIYYYQIQSLFLLGCNKWHSIGEIKEKMQDYMSSFIVNDKKISAWEKFKGKSRRENATRCKDYNGRIQENMLFFQRLSKKNPYGYKLMQACAAVDLKIVSNPMGDDYFYRLSTYNNTKNARPIRDYKDFVFSTCEKKYINNKFVGKIITKNNVIINF